MKFRVQDMYVRVPCTYITLITERKKRPSIKSNMSTSLTKRFHWSCFVDIWDIEWNADSRNEKNQWVIKCVFLSLSLSFFWMNNFSFQYLFVWKYFLRIKEKNCNRTCTFIVFCHLFENKFNSRNYLKLIWNWQLSSYITWSVIKTM